MAENFKGVAEKFRVSLLDGGGGNGPERIQCEVGLDGVKLMSEDGRRTMRIYPLNHIARWALRDNQLVLYTKTPVDVEERAVTLQADRDTARSMLDTLTCSCMQMVELLQNEEGGSSSGKEAEQNEKWAATILKGGGSKGGKKAPEDVEFWHHSDKEGWLQSQGEKLKTWRRRWHVLKDGYIFRFMEGDVTSSSKPRGITNLSEVTEVSDAKDTTGRNHALKLVTEKGNVNYIADSETEQVEWISAIEAAICKKYDDEDPTPRAAPKPKPAATESSRSGSQTLLQQLERGYNSASASSGPRQVKVVGYDGPSAGGYSGGGGHSSSSRDRFSQEPSRNYPSIDHYGASAPPPVVDFSHMSIGQGIAGANTASYSAEPKYGNYGTSGQSGADPNYGNYGNSGHSGAGYVTDPNYSYTGGAERSSSGYSAPDLNHGGGSGNLSQHAVSVSGFDAFSQGPNHPAGNYPSMQATVEDYQSQDYYSGQGQGYGYAPQPQSPAEHQQPQDYWSQQPQVPVQEPEPAYDWSQAPPVAQQNYYDQQYQPQLEMPAPPAPAPAAPPPPPQYQDPSWQALYTQEGQQYWHNTSTGVTQWETPAGMA